MIGFIVDILGAIYFGIVFVAYMGGQFELWALFDPGWEITATGIFAMFWWFFRSACGYVSRNVV